MQPHFRNNPIVVSHPRHWILILASIALTLGLLFWFVLYSIISIHIFVVVLGLVLIIHVIRMLANFPATVCVMHNGLIIHKFRNEYHITWHDVDFITERDSLFDKRLIVASHALPALFKITGLIEIRRNYPVFILWYGQQTNFDEIRHKCKTYLNHKYRIWSWF